MNSRRSFLAGLLALPFAPSIFEEIAKGKSFISLYSPKIITPSFDQILALELERVYPHILELFNREDTFYRAISRDVEIEIVSRDMRIPLQLK